MGKHNVLEFITKTTIVLCSIDMPLTNSYLSSAQFLLHTHTYIYILYENERKGEREREREREKERERNYL